jgi:hypothetical protein
MAWISEGDLVIKTECEPGWDLEMVRRCYIEFHKAQVRGMAYHETSSSLSPKQRTKGKEPQIVGPLLTHSATTV